MVKVFHKIASSPRRLVSISIILDTYHLCYNIILELAWSLYQFV